MSIEKAAAVGGGMKLELANSNPEVTDEDHAETTNGQSEFKQLSHFSSESNQHILQFGVVLSKNHPVLKDPEVLNELR